jgi:hypothetical protein
VDVVFGATKDAKAAGRAIEAVDPCDIDDPLGCDERSDIEWSTGVIIVMEQIRCCCV